MRVPPNLEPAAVGQARVSRGRVRRGSPLQFPLPKGLRRAGTGALPLPGPAIVRLLGSRRKPVVDRRERELAADRREEAVPKDQPRTARLASTALTADRGPGLFRHAPVP